MDEHYEELHDEDVDVVSNKYTHITSEDDTTTKDIKAADKRKNETKRKISSVDKNELPPEMEVDDIETPNEDNHEWRPQTILTDWGRTDDVVTIGNGEEYYFFKIPHKARNFLYWGGEREIEREKKKWVCLACQTNIRQAN